ncbi:ArsR/SmtB family transcription factor [Bacillus sp. WLY-B-L8]|uniref:ArsR/SmtB family transcription factor n=1 Tax=Bacillus multifaciens TaxID=3068506 RepID=UPI0027406EB8|nr:ArsR family transcriptional regulator [Bacillus sp. WLY-B-L8]MDP7977684.1 helix-turn-helix domain-containing protein [Bacillus sp. WLY-B-L8]
MHISIHSNKTDFTLDQILYTLSDHNRLSIVCKLSQIEEMTCSKKNILIAKSTLSQHIKVLREAGIINVCPKGRQRYLSLRKEEVC